MAHSKNISAHSCLRPSLVIPKSLQKPALSTCSSVSAVVTHLFRINHAGIPLDVERGHEVLRITSLPSELWQCPPWGTVAEKHYFLEKMIHCECQHSGSFRNSVMDPETLSKIKLLFKGEISQTHTHVCSALHIQIALKKWWVQVYFDKTENTV